MLLTGRFMSITRINHFAAGKGKESELYDFLKALTPYITGSVGCLSYEVLQHSDLLEKFAVIERWESTDSHKASIANFPQDKMLAAMPLFKEPPSGDYYKGSE
jgi:quinol monooxygenase YgiN